MSVDDLDRGRQLVGIDPDDHLRHSASPASPRTDRDGEVGSATTSWAVPFRATPRHGARRIADRKRATPRQRVGSRMREPSAGHLDRVWPDTDPAGNRLVAAIGRYLNLCNVAREPAQIDCLSCAPAKWSNSSQDVGHRVSPFGPLQRPERGPESSDFECSWQVRPRAKSELRHLSRRGLRGDGWRGPNTCRVCYSTFNSRSTLLFSLRRGLLGRQRASRPFTVRRRPEGSNLQVVTLG